MISNSVYFSLAILSVLCLFLKIESLMFNQILFCIYVTNKRGFFTCGFLKSAYFSIRSINMSLFWLSLVQLSKFSTRFSWSSNILSEEKTEWVSESDKVHSYLHIVPHVHRSSKHVHASSPICSSGMVSTRAQSGL